MDLRSEGDVLQVTTADTRNLAAADYESLKTLDVMGVCWALSTDDVLIYIEKPHVIVLTFSLVEVDSAWESMKFS